MLNKLTEDTDRLYRERFLRDKYGLQDIAVQPAADADVDPADQILMAEVVDDELNAEGRDTSTGEQR